MPGLSENRLLASHELDVAFQDAVAQEGSTLGCVKSWVQDENPRLAKVVSSRMRCVGSLTSKCLHTHARSMSRRKQFSHTEEATAAGINFAGANGESSWIILDAKLDNEPWMVTEGSGVFESGPIAFCNCKMG